MSVADIKPYFRGRLNTLSLKEWTDAFGEEIPENIIDRSYIMRLGAISTLSFNQTCLQLSVPTSVKVYLKGYRTTLQGYDTAATLLNSILLTTLAPAQRLTQTNIKNVTLGSAELLPLAESNDNTIKIEVEFLVTLILNP